MKAGAVLGAAMAGALSVMLSLPAIAAGFGSGGMGGRMGGMGGFRSGMGGFRGGMGTPVVRMGAPMAGPIGMSGRRVSGTQFAFGNGGLQVRIFRGNRFFFPNNRFFFPRHQFFFPNNQFFFPRDRFFFDNDLDDLFFLQNQSFFPRHRFFFPRHRFFFPNNGSSVIAVGAPFEAFDPTPADPTYGAPSAPYLQAPSTTGGGLLTDLTSRWQGSDLLVAWSGEGTQVAKVAFSLLDGDQNVVEAKSVRTPPYRARFAGVPSNAVSLQLAITHSDGSVDSAVQGLSQ